jgi:hypothetical protein
VCRTATPQPPETLVVNRRARSEPSGLRRARDSAGMLECGRGSVSNTAQPTGFRRLDLRDEFSAPRRSDPVRAGRHGANRPNNEPLRHALLAACPGTSADAGQPGAPAGGLGPAEPRAGCRPAGRPSSLRNASTASVVAELVRTRLPVSLCGFTINAKPEFAAHCT